MENEIVNPETAISTEEQSVTAAEGTVENAEATADATKEGTAETAISEAEPSEDEGAAEPEFSLDIKYNKATRSLSREEAVDFAEQGIFYSDTVKPLYNKLDYIAAQRGCSIPELVDGLLAGDEESHRRELAETLGADNPVIEELMKVYRNEQKEKYEKALSDRKSAEENAEKEKQISLEKRLAEEFGELKAEFPEIADFTALPKEVKAEAAKGRDLLSAYLRYTHKENKKAAAAEQAEKAAAKASTGQAASPAEHEDSAVSAFLRGFNGS